MTVQSAGPVVELSTNNINFMQIDEGRTATRTFDIVNNSNLEAIYQFEVDCEESVFKLQSTNGVLKPHSTQVCLSVCSNPNCLTCELLTAKCTWFKSNYGRECYVYQGLMAEDFYLSSIRLHSGAYS